MTCFTDLLIRAVDLAVIVMLLPKFGQGFPPFLLSNSLPNEYNGAVIELGIGCQVALNTAYTVGSGSPGVASNDDLLFQRRLAVGDSLGRSNNDTDAIVVAAPSVLSLFC